MQTYELGPPTRRSSLSTHRCFVIAVLLVACLHGPGCQSPEQAALQPLPDEKTPLTYAELFQRAKSQVGAAQEFFFADRWDEVEQVGDALQKTAARMKTLPAEAIPANKRDRFAGDLEALQAGAAELKKAGQARDATRVNAALQQLNLKIRDLRPQ
ncbi:MAG: hypothetical protein C4297_09025 [Gemmataceae bacterium]